MIHLIPLHVDVEALVVAKAPSRVHNSHQLISVNDLSQNLLLCQLCLHLFHNLLIVLHHVGLDILITCLHIHPRQKEVTIFRVSPHL